MRMLDIYGYGACVKLALKLNESVEPLSDSKAQFVCDVHIMILNKLTPKQRNSVHKKAIASAVSKAS